MPVMRKYDKALEVDDPLLTDFRGFLSSSQVPMQKQNSPAIWISSNARLFYEYDLAQFWSRKKHSRVHPEGDPQDD